MQTIVIAEIGQGQRLAHFSSAPGGSLASTAHQSPDMSRLAQ